VAIVVYTLEARVWCLLTTDNYKEATLKAVNLGSDTDTAGVVTGVLQEFFMDEKPSRNTGYNKSQERMTLKIWQIVSKSRPDSSGGLCIGGHKRFQIRKIILFGTSK
jgi:hypothetical protein